MRRLRCRKSRHSHVDRRKPRAVPQENERATAEPARDLSLGAVGMLQVVRDVREALRDREWIFIARRAKREPFQERSLDELSNPGLDRALLVGTLTAVRGEALGLLDQRT